MGQALYRKYRSKSLAEIVGQEHIINALGSAIKDGRINHAYLFTGPRGTGKTSIARILAHEINNIEYSQSFNLDIIEIDAASNNGVDDVRDLREKVRLAPTSQKYKVYIIDEVHMLSSAAFNALLKTLEEPPEHVVFILATTEVHKLPATIMSRTQRFHFRPVEKKLVTQHLRNIAQTEGISINDQTLEAIAEHGEGSIRDSISLLDQLRNNTEVTNEILESTIGITPKESMQKLIESLNKKDVDQLLLTLDSIIDSGISPAGLSQQLIKNLRNEATKKPEFFDLIDDLIDVPRSYNPKLKLEVIVAKFALNYTRQSTEPTKTKKTDTNEGSREKTANTNYNYNVKQSIKPSEKDNKKTKEEAEPQEQKKEKSSIAASIEELPDDVWQKIVTATKTSSPTLHTVIRQALPKYDPQDNILILKFKFPVHKKRLEEQKYKKEFSKILEMTLGMVPKLDIVLDRDIKPQSNSAEPKPNITPEEDSTDSIINIMGGGEAVSI